MQIDRRRIDFDHPPFIIAELSANHNGRLETALETIDMAKAMGADAIKLQTYTADTLTIDSDQEDFKIRGGLWDGNTLYNLYKEAHTPYEWHKTMFDHARDIGITCFSTPFDASAVDLLEDLNTPAYKIASFEAIDTPLIRYVAQTRKPLIISTGMANLEEITEAVATARDQGCEDIALLHCISSYPAPATQSNLRTMQDMARRFNVVVGLSDHTLGTAVAIASVALGACLIEKHVTLNKNDEGPDSKFSLEPEELKRLCEDSKEAWEALGTVSYDLKPAELSSIKFRRSIYVVKDIAAGERFTVDNIRSIRPGYGLLPKYFDEIIGKEASCDLVKGTALNWEVIS